ncbi:LOW QUALITY PROTEIN: hypothetical protein ACHAW6_000121, partial [Cyclotella cf. meneghiniana]
KLSDLKESHPLQVAEFALAVGIANEPAFNCARYHNRTHKFGIELPKTVEEAYAIDKATGTSFWHDAIELEMKNVRVAFDVLPDGVVPLSDHQCMKCHMICDVKMEDFCRKARLPGGHMTKVPALTYASVMSQETVHIALLVAVLNSIDIWAADVLNAYITVPCHKKIWTTLGEEFGDDCDRKVIIVQALYGLKSSGAAFRVHLAGCLHKMGYCPCPADPDLWLKEQIDPKGNVIMPISSVMLMTHLWSTITQDISRTRLTTYFPSSLTQLVPLRCILGQISRRRPLKTVLWHGDSVP